MENDLGIGLGLREKGLEIVGGRREFDYRVRHILAIELFA
jgi:hypothetical protein